MAIELLQEISAILATPTIGVPLPIWSFLMTFLLQQRCLEQRFYLGIATNLFLVPPKLKLLHILGVIADCVYLVNNNWND
jgi:hypothetical protein